MDTVTVILEGLRVISGFLLLLFVPGFVLSLVIFPRFNDVGIIERLAYSTVLSIGSVIALVLFMDVVLGVDTLPVNIIMGIAVFSCFAFLVWLVERWYLNSRFKKSLEPRLSADYQKVQTFYTRELNAAKDRFRQDTRTMVVYHEHHQSGLNHIEHSYLLDVGEEIDIQQVAENKVKVTDSVILPPPYLRTPYFELVIREYTDEGLSLVDDLQIYPVLVLKKPDKTLLRFVLQRGTTHISERIYKKTSTTEVGWIYSHDFHLFAIIHNEDTLAQMVDLILGKLDEITLSLKNGIHISSQAEDRQILKDAYDEVMIEKPHDLPVKPQEIVPQPEVPFSAELWEIPRRPVILTEVEIKKIPKRPVVQIPAEPTEIPTTPEGPTEESVLVEIRQRPVILTGPEPKEIPTTPEGPTEESVLVEIPKRPVILIGPEPKIIPTTPDVRTDESVLIEIPKRPVIQPVPEPKIIPKPPEGLTRVTAKDIPEPPDELTEFERREKPVRPAVQTEVEPEQIIPPPKIQTGVELKKIFRHPPEQQSVEQKEIPKPPDDQYRVEQQEILRRQKARIGIQPKAQDKRKLQKEILRDLDVFGVTPDSFGKSKKNMENIIIPKKSDVPKKLADVEEDVQDLDWLYED